MTVIPITSAIYAVISTHILTKRMTKYLLIKSISHGISTHILTKRMTICADSPFIDSIISTHILTKRMTRYIFQLEVVHVHFNSHPHEEDDVDFIVQRFFDHCISTHILTKRMTMALPKSTSLPTFQLTSSRRG